MRKFNLLSVLNTGLLVIIFIFLFSHIKESQKQNIGYVDNVRLFQEFNMVRDMSVIEGKKIYVAEKELDSLYFKFNSLINKENHEANQLKFLIASKSKIIQERKKEMNQNLSKIVWSRVDESIKEYSTRNKLKIILGSNNIKNVLFVDRNINITTDFIEFLNAKYEGN